MKNYIPLILGMAAVTYLPRLIPLLVMTQRPLPAGLRRFLLYIPYTALSALVVRGVMQSTADIRLGMLAGIVTAGLCSWFKGGLMVSVLVSIIIAFMVLQI